MVKNLKGGNGHKNLARKNVKTGNSQATVRLKGDSLEHYAFVEKNLGNGHLDVLCDDDVLRRCRIPGKFKKHKRNNLITVNGFILIGEFGFETIIKDKIQKCDLLETYSEQDFKEIMEISNNDDKLYSFLQRKRSDKIASYVDDGFDFSDKAGEEVDIGNLKQSMAAASAAASAACEFDFDSI